MASVAHSKAKGGTSSRAAQITSSAAYSAAHLAKHSCFGVSHGFRGGLGLGWGVGGGFFRPESGFRRGRGSGIGNGNKGPIIPHESVKLGGLLLM